MSRHLTARAGTKMLGRYRIERELGRGGMGVVYVATDENTGRLVALKTTSVAQLGSGEKSRNQRRERFVREVRALTQVNHENVVHVFDAGECDDADLGWLLFYTMEYVEGTTLASLVQERGALNGGEAAAVVMQVAAGLGEAHAQGIIHRDVKPANIFLSVDGRAKIGDFGIAKIEGSTQITRRDQLVGTPNYLAPEQILGDAVGPQTDVFALGALFFVITQNKPLRQQVDAGALLASANGNDPVTRMLSVQNLSEGLKRAVARSLERDPARRYVDGAAFADALAEHATRPPSLAGAPAPRQAPPTTHLVEGTADRSSAFISSGQQRTDSMPEADAVDIQSLPDVSGGDASSIEAIAAAMLGEVERRATGTFKQPSTKNEDALPVAQTESTVMFNLRALEEEHHERSGRVPVAAPAPPPSSATSSLPVARSEPTAMFQLDQLEDPKKKKKPAAKIELEPVTDDDGPPPAWEDATRETAPIEAAPRSSASSSASRNQEHINGPTLLNDDPPPVSFEGPTSPAAFTAPTKTSTASLAAPKPPMKLPPRHVLIAATFASGLLFGLLLAIAMAPSAPKTTPTEDLALDVAPLRARPALCPERAVTSEEQAQAAAFLDEARALKRDGASPSKVLDRLRLAIAKDPGNHALFYELGRVSSGREQDDADECVCQLAADSKECSAVEKARGR
jgi:serine/threonine-protein kinase